MNNYCRIFSNMCCGIVLLSLFKNSDNIIIIEIPLKIITLETQNGISYIERPK
jgi:hypothetical protein